MPPRKIPKKPKPLPIPGTSSYPGKKDGKGMEQPQWEACRAMLEDVYQTDEDGILIAEIFCQLPDKVEYADYYETIPEPECLDNVAMMLSNQVFPTPDKFFAQLLLIFLNAKHFNEEGSQLWEDANDFEEQIWAEWRKYAAQGVFKAEPHLPKNETRRGKKGKAGSAGPSTAPPQSPATPAPMAPIPELPKPILINPSASSSRQPPPPIQAAPPPAPLVPQSPNHPQPRGLTAADQAVVSAVDNRMPRWPGPQAVIPGPSQIAGIPGSGWWGEGAPEYERSAGGQTTSPSRIKAVLTAISGYRDQQNVRLADTLERVPPLVNIPYLSWNGNISLAGIRLASEQFHYRSLGQFDMDMTRLFERARRWYLEGTIEYGNILTLQRLYHGMTSTFPLSFGSGGVPPPTPTHFSSIAAGPGRARPQSEVDGPLGITSQKVSIKDRTFTPEARHKGLSYKTGDFIHLINPDDPSKPIIAQIFKTYIPSKGYRQYWITACWYFRPEQTVHTADRQFVDREVLKTGHFTDHPVEDIIERVSLQFFVKYVRGRSRAGEYYPGWPLYVCHTRFNDRIWASIRIKNWASCIPEELRQSDFMSLIPFERIIDPLLFPSPFTTGIEGPGFIAEPRGQVSEEDDEERVSSIPTLNPVQGGSSRTPLIPVRQPPHAQASASATASASAYRPPVPASAPPASAVSGKTFGAMYGGQQAMDQIAYKEYLPIETARLFERDARQTVLWFSGPPLPCTQESARPTHSLEYLRYLSGKRKRLEEE